MAHTGSSSSLWSFLVCMSLCMFGYLPHHPRAIKSLQGAKLAEIGHGNDDTGVCGCGGDSVS